ncbi:hypothetical protein DMENIID0001_139130 [Sergentomyia squamirostris]
MEIVPVYFLLVFIVCVNAVQDWCKVEKEHCNGHPHIACKNTNFPNGDCVNVQVVKVDQELIDTILEKHNYYRNKVAKGNLKGYPQAAKMQKMMWNDDLAYLATVHVKHCQFEHDKCRATPDFPYAGQNLAFHATTGHLDKNLTGIVSFMIDEWFNEYSLVSPDCVDKFTKDHLEAGHFTAMIREKSNCVGCAMITYNFVESGKEWTGLILTCDYAETNMLNWPIYTKGAPCSECTSIGKSVSSDYDSLCSP